MSDVRNLSGDVLLRDTVVASFEDGQCVFIDHDKAPFLLCRTKDLTGWLESRLMDDSRVNSRMLKKILGLSSMAGIEAALFVRGASVIDRYWFRDSQNSELTYEDIRIRKDTFFNVALRGDPNGFALSPEPTGELTTAGSFEKGWHLEDGHWYLYKQGSPEELFSEKFISEVGARLGFDMAQYQIVGNCIKTPSFAEELNLEPISSLVDEDEDYMKCYRALETLGNDSLLDDYLRLLWTDTLCFNMDRHTGNIGILRDDAGQVVKLAPNYDNNIALISRGKVKDPKASLKLFHDLYHKLICSDYKIAERILRIAPSPLGRDKVLECIDAAGGVPSGYQAEDVLSIVTQGQYYLDDLYRTAVDQVALNLK